MSSRGFLALLPVVGLLAAVPSIRAQSEPRYVIVLSSFEQQFSPHNVFTGAFRTELTSRSPQPIQFIDVSVPTSVGADGGLEVAPTIDYLKSTFAVYRPDLIVSLGATAAVFVQQHRHEIFPDTPLLFSSVDRRFVQNRSFTDREAAVAVDIDLASIAANIVQVLPATTTLAVVTGNSPRERAWQADLAAALQPFKGRLNVVWYHELAFEEMLKRSASLPTNSAILFANLGIDGRGVPRAEERVLSELHAVANAPIFGIYSHQLGQGIVGGPLMAVDQTARAAAGAALRILDGESPGNVSIPLQGPGAPAFDARELARWRIGAARLPPGSLVLFSDTSAWRRYRTVIITVASIGVAETLLVAGLLVLHVKRRRAERLMQESEERFRVLANTAPVMIWVSGADKKVTDINRAWLEFTGRTREQELGDGWVEGVHRDDRAGCLETYSTAFDRREAFSMEYRLRRHDGEYRWILDAGIPRLTPDGSLVGYAGSAIDVTDHKRAKAALSNLSQQLMQAQEQERTWIARELHDDVCQRLAAMTMRLDHLTQRPPGDREALVRTLTELSRQSWDLGSDIQAISHRLHSSKLEVLGLPAAAAAFCDELADQHEVTIDFSHRDVPATMPEETKLGLFRVLQESLMNAVKHSGARDFEVELWGSTDSVCLIVVDHGVGFDPDAALGGRGLGLVSMRERLGLIDGELRIESRPGEGTIVRAFARVAVAVVDLPSDGELHANLSG